MNIAETIKRIIVQFVKPSIIYGVVKSYDQSTNTVECDIDGLLIDEVKVSSVITMNGLGIKVEPKIGSRVILGRINDRAEDLIVLKFDEIVKYQLNADKIELNGDDYSIVKAEELQQVLAQNKAFIDAFKQVLSVPVNEPGNGAPSVFQQALNTALGSLPFEDGIGINNSNIKHG